MNDSQRRFQARRAIDTASRPNGSQKKSSATAPSWRSFVHSRLSPVQATSSASGQAIGPSSRVRVSPRTSSQPSSTAAPAITA